MTDEEILSQLTDSEILFLTLLGEARGEPIEGQVAVANVIMNRAKLRKQIIKVVCLSPKQFSCWNANDPNRILLLTVARRLVKGEYKIDEYKQLHWIAHGIIERQLDDNTHGKDHYITTALFNSENRPYWARFPTTTPITIGNHTFLNV